MSQFADFETDNEKPIHEVEVETETEVPKEATANVEPYPKDTRPIERSKYVNDRLPILSIPRYNFEGYVATLGGMAFKDVFVLPDTPESKNYQRVVGNSVTVMSRQSWDTENLNHPDHKWMIGLRGSEQGHLIKGGDYIVNASDTVKGEPAILRATKRLGAGVSKSIPLEASGFYVNLIPSKSPQLSAMMVEILSKGEEIGYRTGGVGYDLGSTFIEQEIMAHIFGNIRGSTLAGVAITEVSQYIKAPDYRRLMIAQLWATYQTGVIYDQPCIANHNTCQAVHSNRLNLASVLRINESRFSDDQYKHMLRAAKGVTVEDVTRYQSLNTNDNLVYRIRGDEDDANQINITLSIPYIIASHTVYTDIINHLNSLLPRALTEHGTPKSRTEWLSSQLKAVPILANIAWISKLTIGLEANGDVETFDDSDSIRDIISVVSDNDETNDITDKFVEAFSDFMIRNDTSMVLVRNEECPSCHQQVSDADGNIPTHIPLEAESLFLAIVQYHLLGKGRLRQYVI